MKLNLFSDFEAVSSKQWKQQIQYELKGADYNETLVWESPEGIKVKPFYHNDETEISLNAIVPTKPFAIFYVTSIIYGFIQRYAETHQVFNTISQKIYL